MTGQAIVEERRYEVRDGQRPLTFTGRLLAESDSQTGNDVRWTELTLYVTTNGKYVIEKVGRSDVYHATTCPRRSKGELHVRLNDALNDDRRTIDQFEPCDVCNPTLNTTPVCVERDIFSASLFLTVEDMIKSLYRDDKNSGMPFLSHIASTLLARASENDENIARILHTSMDVT